MKNALLSLLFFVSVSSASGQIVSSVEDLSLKCLMQVPAVKAKQHPLIIMLHGYGSNEKDLFELRTFFPQNYIIVAARAPYPIGGDGYQWFEKEVVNGKYSGKKEQLEKSRNSILKLIVQLVNKYNADPGKVYVMGFSQGAMMSYEVGLTAPKSVKGIGILSGILPESLKPLIRKSQDLNALRIFIAHGTADSRLPYADGKAGYDYLQSIGLKPELHSYKGMDHTISKEVMSDLIKWLR
jgi:phospholipase/carboxylesterase